MTVKELVQGYLGKGVDAFQITYRGSESAFSPPDRNRVINVTPDMIDESVFDTTSIEQTYGSSFAEFIHKFSLEVGLKGSYGPFSASVSSQFDTSNTRISSAQFRRLSNTINGSMQSIGDDVAALKGHLTEDFKKALAKADPMYLLETFGTHVVVKEIIGGAAEYICHSAESTTISESDFKAAAEAKYQSVGGSIAGSTNVNTSDKETLKKVEGSLSLTVYGGDPKTQQSLRRNEQGGWENWAATVADNPVLLGYPRGGDGLIPIWKTVNLPKASGRLTSKWLPRISRCRSSQPPARPLQGRTRRSWSLTITNFCRAVR